MIYLISLIFLSLPAYLIRFSVFGIPTTVLEVLIYVVFILGLWQARGKWRLIPWKIYLPIGLFIIALVISVIIAPDKRTALGEFKGFFFDPLLVFWLVFQFLKREDIPKVIWALAFSGLFVSVHTIVQKILGNVTTDGRVIGLFGYSPNYVALYLTPIAVLLIAYGSDALVGVPTNRRDILLMVKTKYWLSAICYLLSAICLVAIYFSGSRGGLLATGAGLAVFFITYFWSWIRGRLSAKIIIAILCLMAIYMTWVFFRPDFSASLDSGRVVTSNNLRWQIWQTTLELGTKHPISGVGLGNFQNAFNELTQDRGNFPEYITPMALTPHNLFLSLWLSTGILGFFSFIWLLILFYRQAIKKLPEGYSPILIAVMSSILIYGLIEASIWKNDLSIIFFTLWGLAWII